jgi:hypothetical protein
LSKNGKYLWWLAYGQMLQLWTFWAASSSFERELKQERKRLQTEKSKKSE